jgi:hypothetical protein
LQPKKQRGRKKPNGDEQRRRKKPNGCGKKTNGCGIKPSRKDCVFNGNPKRDRVRKKAFLTFSQGGRTTETETADETELTYRLCQEIKIAER